MPKIEETSISNYKKAGNSMLDACVLHICHSEKKCIDYIMGSKYLW